MRKSGFLQLMRAGCVKKKMKVVPSLVWQSQHGEAEGQGPVSKRKKKKSNKANQTKPWHQWLEMGHSRNIHSTEGNCYKAGCFFFSEQGLSIYQSSTGQIGQGKRRRREGENQSLFCCTGECRNFLLPSSYQQVKAGKGVDITTAPSGIRAPGCCSQCPLCTPR